MTADQIVNLWKEQNISGWCSPAKAKALAEIVFATKPTIAVELGVFGGSSLIPVALALKANGVVGKIFGVDPYDKQACLEEMIEPANLEWWSTVDLEQIHQEALRHISNLSLHDHVEIMRTTSQDAVKSFEDASIGFLNIDGNHSEVSSMRDVELWLPKVAVGGHIYFDDLQWSEGGKFTTHRALEYLQENGCRPQQEVGDGLLLDKIY